MNKRKFKTNLNAKVRIRPLIHYSVYDTYIDDEWQISDLGEEKFRLYNPANGYNIDLGYDSCIGWDNDFSISDGTKRGLITLKGQVSLIYKAAAHSFKYEPLTYEQRNIAMNRTASERVW